MPDVTPTRSALIELSDERRAMQEGHAFLEEKCLLLAAEIVRQLRRYDEADASFSEAWKEAAAWLEAAISRHGLQGLEVYEPRDPAGASLEREIEPLLGLVTQRARLSWRTSAPGAAEASPEGDGCRDAFASLVAAAAPLAAISGNLSRLHDEYRRSLRRARALQEVLLPELAGTIAEVETRLEELEQEEAVAIRRPRRAR